MLIGQFLGEFLRSWPSFHGHPASHRTASTVWPRRPSNNLINLRLAVPYTQSLFPGSAPSASPSSRASSPAVIPLSSCPAFKLGRRPKRQLQRKQTPPSTQGKVLVVLQFSFAILLIICTLIVVETNGLCPKPLRRLRAWRPALSLEHRRPPIRTSMPSNANCSSPASPPGGRPSTNVPPDDRYTTTPSGSDWTGKNSDDKIAIDRLSEDQDLA